MYVVRGGKTLDSETQGYASKPFIVLYYCFVLREYKLVGLVWLCLGIMLGRVCRRNGVSSFRMGYCSDLYYMYGINRMGHKYMYFLNANNACELPGE